MSISKPFTGTPMVGGINVGGPNNVQFHLHGSDTTSLSGGYFKDLNTGEAVPGSPMLNGYEAAMADLHAQQVGLDRFNK